MNQVLIAALVAISTAVGGFFYGVNFGEEREFAKRAREDQIVEKVADASQKAAATAIAANRPRNVTIKQETEREVQTNTIYADCRHSPEQLQRINSALTGRPVGAGDGKLPQAGATE